MFHEVTANTCESDVILEVLAELSIFIHMRHMVASVTSYRIGITTLILTH